MGTVECQDCQLLPQQPDSSNFFATNRPNLSGQHSIRYKDGSTYQGALLLGKRHGKGVYVTPNGYRFKGSFENDVAFGYGELTWEEGSYNGGWKDNLKHGQGREVNAGDVFEGSFLFGKYHGMGKYNSREGWQYEGVYLEGEPSGRGVMHFANGDYFEGFFKEGQPQEGIMYYRSGEVYQGELREGLRWGRGRLTSAQGEVSEGAWENNRLKGMVATFKY